MFRKGIIMKKRFTKILSLVLVAVAAMSLSITSFAADNKPAPITPTAETTLGDVCRQPKRRDRAGA